VVPSPCEELAFACPVDAPGELVARVVGPEGDPLAPRGAAALAAPGDILLANDEVVVVIEALDHPHYLGPSGGGVLDLATRGGDDDVVRNLVQVTGLLPQDAARYTDLRVWEEADRVAVQVSGELDGRPGVRIVTRYELRACEPGLRVRTELINGSTDPLSMLLGDGWYWGGRGSLPFTPTPGGGFEHPAFGLSTVGDALREVPFMASAAHVQPGAAYATVACDRPEMQGFHSEEVSLIGAPKRVYMPRDAEVFERFIAVAPGASVAGAADVALEVRRQQFGEAWATLAGRVVGGADARAPTQVVVSQGASSLPISARVPWTHAVPDADGRFTVRVPPDRTYTVAVEAFGQPVAEAEVEVGPLGGDVGDIGVPAVGELVLDATVDGATDPVLVLVRPTSDEAASDHLGRFLGRFRDCSPLLGHPYGPSPACDRVLVEGPTSVVVPPGTYDLFAVAGPFSTLARQQVSIVAGETARASLALQVLPLQPPGTLSGDFHVHGQGSFDSSLPPEERVRALVAARVDVIASTEHDVVSAFGPVADALGVGDRVRILDGTESTGHILFPLFEDSSYPRVIGHFNFWPVPYDPLGPWRGAPWDELQEPGALMGAMAAEGWPADVGVAQLNHPWGGFQFGRDYGFADAIDVDLTQPLPGAYDGSGPSLFRRTPPGAAFANSAYHAQEVMNGSDNLLWQSYRAFWFYLMNQGIFRTGTANSDSHSLSDAVVGFPRNLVWTNTSLADFDAGAFNVAIREGRVMGTNGPVLDVSLVDAGDAAPLARPSLAPVVPPPGSALRVVVRAAPWVPVDEVRVVVNGAVARVYREELAPLPADPFGVDGLDRLEVTVPLSELVAASGDAWIVVEAGHALEPLADLDCDGWPDTGDHNGDGRVDAADVEGAPRADAAGCLDVVGPYREPELPAREDPAYAFSQVVPGGYPAAFTNPIWVDGDADGAWGGQP
jgi:hypothetical protein